MIEGFLLRRDSRPNIPKPGGQYSGKFETTFATVDAFHIAFGSDGVMLSDLVEMTTMFTFK